MGYHALNIGQYETYTSNNFVEKTCEKDVFPLISANLEETDPSVSCIQKYIVQEINGIRIGVTGILPDISKSPLFNANFKCADPTTSLKEIIPELQKKSDFIILLSEFDSKQTIEIMNNFSNIDIALCVDTKPVEITNPSTVKVMSITNRGKEIGIIKVEKTDSAVIVKNIRRVSLDNAVESDPAIESMVKNAMEELERKKQADKMRISRKKHLEILKLTPEEFIKQYNKN